MITPVLNVPDVGRTTAWYRRLGFRLLDTVDFPPTWALLALGEGQLILQSGGRQGPVERRDADLHVTVDDVEALYRSLDREMDVAVELHETEYGLKEFVLRDPDGHLLTFMQAR
ncbi:MAG: VOC family protein [Alphaproteobacteria bacterium]|nr:VOC family protein [Alphaproteobacteria bacterium]